MPYSTPKVPKRVLAAMRRCIHSSIECRSRNLLPDYTCNISVDDNSRCKLYDRTFYCERREEFPESHNTQEATMEPTKQKVELLRGLLEWVSAEEAELESESEVCEFPLGVWERGSPGGRSSRSGSPEIFLYALKCPQCGAVQDQAFDVDLCGRVAWIGPHQKGVDHYHTLARGSDE